MSKGHLLGRFALGAAAGLTLGYTAVRLNDMLADRAAPAPAKPRDPKAYGAARRLLTVTGLVRSTASSAVWAFALSDGFDRGMSKIPAPIRLPLFVALLTAIETVREWPVDYIEDHQLERIYGNSERGVEAWAGEKVKAAVIGGGVAMVLAGVAGSMMRRAPQRWPWIAIAGLPALMAFANVVVPTF